MYLYIHLHIVYKYINIYIYVYILCSSVICLSAGKAKMLNCGENRTRDLCVTSPHALSSEPHGQPDFKTVNYDILRGSTLKYHNLQS